MAFILTRHLHALGPAAYKELCLGEHCLKSAAKYTQRQARNADGGTDAQVEGCPPPHRLQWWECATCERLGPLIGPRPGAGSETRARSPVCKLRRPAKWTGAQLAGMQGLPSCRRRSSVPPCSPAQRSLPIWETACSEWCVSDAQDSTRMLLWKQDVLWDNMCGRLPPRRSAAHAQVC